VQLEEALPAALGKAEAVINCAGPFAHTAQAIARAAVTAGCHYVDITAEPQVIKDLWDTHGDRAADRGVALLPGAGFYCTLSDCLAKYLVADRGRQVEMTVAYLVEGWRMTRASRQTAMDLAGKPRLVYTAGRLTTDDPGPNASRFRFPAPHGEQAVVAYPGGEVLTIPRHVDTERVRVLMTASTFGPETFTSEGIAPEERAKSSFLVVVAASSPQGTVRAWVKGRDIYRVGALAAVEAVLRLAGGGRGKAGPLAPAQVLEAEGLFARLGESGLVDGMTVDEGAG
jgi:short subunit dehydrogenase-like uncharacterized protein